MTKYKTREKDYTGCNKEIAELLKQNKDAWCYVWDNDSQFTKREWVIRFIPKSPLPYETEGSLYINARPIPIKRRFKKASEIIKLCEEHNYTFTDGFNIDSVFLWKEFEFTLRMIFELSGTESCNSCVPEEWLEEVYE